MAQEQSEIEGTPELDEAYRLEMLRGECQRDLDAFSKLHGRAFLLLRRSTGAQPLRPPERPSRTLVTDLDELEKAEAQELPSSEYLVFPIRKTERSIIARFYSVGHTRNNDVVIRDVSVSKFHAFFQDAEDGVGFVLLDAKSTNGTFVNDVRVPAHGQGEPVKVATGDLIRLGNVELSFLTAAELCALVRSLSNLLPQRR